MVLVGEIVNMMLYMFKTRVQWNQLPVKALFSEVCLSWQSVYHHSRKWRISGAWKDCWTKFLKKHRARLDLSSVDLDGSHTLAIRGCKAIEYQGRKKRKMTNALYLTNRQGLPLAIS